MAADTCGMCLLGAMDRLWFHQIILFAENPLFLSPKTLKPALPASESLQFSSKNGPKASTISKQEQETSPVIASPQDETASQESDHSNEERPTRLNDFVSSKTRSHSSSPISSAQKQKRKNLGYHSNSMKFLQKSMSCKSFGELELEEVKGFRDLGFVFQKENLSKRVVSLIPGLQRIDAHNNIAEDEVEEEKGMIMRPYLSEAWMIKTPESPLLNLRMPRVSTTEDMKKHLKDWARAVASAAHQES